MFSNSFPDKAVMADLAARMLLEIEAVHFRADEPYRLTSGLASPVYIDCRKLISFPRIRSALMDFATATILREAGFEQFDSVAGGETAGIPFAAWISERMGLPMQYIRKKPKGFGRNAQIEGEMPEGSRVLLVEDLTTDGGSKIKFAEAIRDCRGRDQPCLRAVLLRHLSARRRKRLADQRHHAALPRDLAERSCRRAPGAALRRGDARSGRRISRRPARMVGATRGSIGASGPMTIVSVTLPFW